MRIYADTSIFGGAFDAEFNEPSRAFLDEAIAGAFRLVTSAVVQAELEAAPPKVRRLFERVLPSTEIVDVSAEALRLQRAYVKANIVSARWSDDALHVALASAGGCGVIVSWNFRHIVHFQKIPLYNAINEVNGYRPISIYSPREVISYED
ncbi:MAG: type II toxin-antitoxin system VapC family toxin [Candidatus Marinimicrobia bacterium]|nr:type II toxin-antitoxin system VapC family toxin [Candidatus Neomarinimicrobiota bacterium]